VRMFPRVSSPKPKAGPGQAARLQAEDAAGRLLHVVARGLGGIGAFNITLFRDSRLPAYHPTAIPAPTGIGRIVSPAVLAVAATPLFACSR
jgi:hypothetical protein